MVLDELGAPDGLDMRVVDPATARAAAREALAAGVAELVVFSAGVAGDSGDEWLPALGPIAKRLRVRVLLDVDRTAPSWIYSLLRLKGARVRALSVDRPLRFLVAGETAALVALGRRHGNGEALLWTREPALVASFREFFDVAWEAAAPLEVEARPAPHASGT